MSKSKVSKNLSLEIVNDAVETQIETPVVDVQEVEIVNEDLLTPVEDPIPVIEAEVKEEPVVITPAIKIPEVKLPDVDPVDPNQEYVFTEQRIKHYAGSYGLLIRTGPKEEENALIVDLRQFILRKRPTEVIVKFMDLVRSYGEDVTHREAFQKAYQRIVALERAAKKAQKEKVKALLEKEGPIDLTITE